MISDAIGARKHILSQKPFVLDLKTGRQLVHAADRAGVCLAVNQNGRWAPHFAYLRQAVDTGLLGDVMAAHLSVHWNHDWIAGTAFDSVHHALLFDFAIHWFDILNCFMQGRPAKQVFASITRASAQKSKPPLLGQVIIEYEGAQASLVFDGTAPHGPLDQTILIGTNATITSQGKNLNNQKVQIHTPEGHSSPRLRGAWFPDGFHGTMAELLCAIEENRTPDNSARSNLAGLALCFAAVKSAETGQPVKPMNGAGILS
jgi:predicted dehydrogenase